MHKKAVVLVSGGLDSATCLAIAKHDGFRTYALSFDYGQRNRAELNAAQQITQLLGADVHKVISCSLNEFAGSALTDPGVAVPQGHDPDIIPVTYVPARNTIFLALALGWAESLGAHDIFIGANAVDYSNYPDCRPDYIKAFEDLAQLATKDGREGHRFKIHAPLLRLSKAEIIQLGHSLGIDYSQTLTCYNPSTDGKACGKCPSCILRATGFKEAGLADPTRYIDSN